MSRRLVQGLALLALAGAVAGGCALWLRRPWRAVVSVNGHALSAGELSLRAQTLFDDARRTDLLVVPEGREGEALGHYRRQAAKTWIVKEVLLAEALARGVVVSPADEQDSLAQMASRLRSRSLTPDQFFREGPLPETLKRRDFKESVLVNKFTAKEVGERIAVTHQEIEARLAEMRKAGRTASRKDAIDALRAERFRAGFRALVRELYGKAVVRSPEFPELERIEGVVSDAVAGAKERK